MMTVDQLYSYQTAATPDLARTLQQNVAHILCNFGSDTDEVTAKALLRCGAAPKAARAGDGWTGLHIAVAAGHADCASMLFEAGAVPTLDSFGRMPDECAVPPVLRCLLADDE